MKKMNINKIIDIDLLDKVTQTLKNGIATIKMAGVLKVKHPLLCLIRYAILLRRIGKATDTAVKILHMLDE